MHSCDRTLRGASGGNESVAAIGLLLEGLDLIYLSSWKQHFLAFT